ncbi:choline transporter-like protein 5-B isoform X1 [Strigops habroptila]|uniref:choline transporter-like protein 5-B isoform X1 n=1 Tax=Strigops habroptila TaxID=2489341 RepID=UPI0011CF24C1|nr:choline transporter-like protein 5-B isoform X1 [Strigops habroptila]XP_030343174.1 choline transporter-like protein 5-B isoform X1 [Strigops habroptila]XP_030343175.1 choline transporter-like protein 5-B isoform X1 [Strigops habroptila]XP_030343176.1 choline transporter-like protein 5-B isoform X1 [Strigops habroptila]XP_030343177.1 choline transporter-like protein 5-B isoform X1 [Strigops habroptila]XP_030343178.1 choline transporter-like protein 5-B isoform X1 [Strigops habroptila]XP_03
MIVSMLFPVLLRFAAGVLFWIFIFGVIGIIGYGIWHCYWEYDHLKGIPGSDLTVYDTGFQRDFRVCLQLRQTWLAFMKLPQVLLVLGAPSGAGLSVPGVPLELLVLARSVAYGCSRAFPFSAWGEVLFLLLQTMTLGFLMQHLRGTREEGRCWWLVTGCYWAPSSPPIPPPGSSPSSKQPICPSSSSAGSFKPPPTTAKATRGSSRGSPLPSCSGEPGAGLPFRRQRTHS